MFYFYFIFLHFPLSGPVLINISLPIIPCMIMYVTNNKEPWTNLIVTVLSDYPSFEWKCNVTGRPVWFRPLKLIFSTCFRVVVAQQWHGQDVIWGLAKGWWVVLGMVTEGGDWVVRTRGLHGGPEVGFPARFGSNFSIMDGSASGPGSTFKVFLRIARVRAHLQVSLG